MGLTIALIAAAIAFTAAAIAMTIAAIKLWRAADSVDKIVRRADEELIPLLQEARVTVKNVDAVAANVREKVDRASRLVVIIEDILTGGAAALAASKAAQTSSIALKSLLEGVKLGLRALRGAPKSIKEVSEDER
ncbi:MAG: hypothetical protein Q7N50_08235 [Armatimonadota bacterium]|nr:hypothetical protein [Armatimonadota bacterium]